MAQLSVMGLKPGHSREAAKRLADTRLLAVKAAYALARSAATITVASPGAILRADGPVSAEGRAAVVATLAEVTAADDVDVVVTS